MNQFYMFGQGFYLQLVILFLAVVAKYRYFVKKSKGKLLKSLS